jgi:hypothetical protein
MSEVQDIIYGVTGQSLHFDAPEGRPSSVTSVTVYPATTGDDGTSEDATSGSATVETNPDTTVDAASGISQADARKLNVAATTGVEVGRRYLLTSAANGGREWIEVARFVANDYITCAYPLLNDYVTNDTLESTRITASVDSTWIADSANISDDYDPNPGYRVRWVYVVGGKTYAHDAYFDVVRYPSGHGVTSADMNDFRPQWHHEVSHFHRDDGGQRLIDEAYRQVRWDMHEAGVPDEMVRHSEGVDHLVKYKAFAELLKSKLFAGGAVDAGAVELAMSDYQSRLDQLIRVTVKLPVAADTSGAGVPREALGIWER